MFYAGANVQLILSARNVILTRTCNSERVIYDVLTLGTDQTTRGKIIID